MIDENEKNLGSDIDPVTGNFVKKKDIETRDIKIKNYSEVRSEQEIAGLVPKLSEREANLGNEAGIKKRLLEISSYSPEDKVKLYHSCVVGPEGSVGEAIRIAGSVELGVRQNKSDRTIEGRKDLVGNPMSNPTLGIVPMRFWNHETAGGFEYSVPRREAALPGESNQHKRIVISDQGVAGIMGSREDSFLSLLEVEGKIIIGPNSKPTDEQINRIQEINEWTTRAREKLSPILEKINELLLAVDEKSEHVILKSVIDGSFENKIRTLLLRAQEEKSQTSRESEENLISKVEEKNKLSQYLEILNGDSPDVNFLKKLNDELYFGTYDIDSERGISEFVRYTKEDLRNRVSDIEKDLATQGAEPEKTSSEDDYQGNIQAVLEECDHLRTEYKNIYSTDPL